MKYFGCSVFFNFSVLFFKFSMNLQEDINSFIDYKMDYIGFICVSADIQMYDIGHRKVVWRHLWCEHGSGVNGSHSVVC